MNAHTLNSSFEAVYRRSYKVIYRFTKGLCRTKEDAEDVTQETFARAYAAIEHFKHDRPIENWLIRIAQNTFLDHKRKERRRPITIQEAAQADDRGMDASEDTRPLPDAEVIRRELPRNLISAISRLDEDSRRLIFMAHVEQRPYSEIAEQLGLTLSTVRSRLHRACRKARHLAARP